MYNVRIMSRRNHIMRNCKEGNLKTTKKIRTKGPDGEMVERFIKTNDTDHWVHALNYSNIAALLVEDLGLSAMISAPPSVGKVKVGSNAGNKPVERTGW